MRKLGKVSQSRLKVGFSMRRYQRFGTIKSLWEWLYIVLRGGGQAVRPTHGGSISKRGAKRPILGSSLVVHRSDNCEFARRLGMVVWIADGCVG